MAAAPSAAPWDTWPKINGFGELPRISVSSALAFTPPKSIIATNPCPGIVLSRAACFKTFPRQPETLCIISPGSKSARRRYIPPPCKSYILASPG